MRQLLALLMLPAAAAAQGGGPSSSQNAPSNPSFTLQNRAAEAVEQLYATPSSNDRWGTDRLSRFTVPPGTGFPVRLPTGPCAYDIKIVYAGGRTEELRRVDTCRVDSLAVPGGRPTTASAKAAPGATSGQPPSFRLVNRGRREIYEFYASPAGDEEWGDDRLGEDTLPAGRTLAVKLPDGQCLYDVRIVYANGDATERRKVDLCKVGDLRVP